MIREVLPRITPFLRLGDRFVSFVENAHFIEEILQDIQLHLPRTPRKQSNSWGAWIVDARWMLIMLYHFHRVIVQLYGNIYDHRESNSSTSMDHTSYALIDSEESIHSNLWEKLQS